LLEAFDRGRIGMFIAFVGMRSAKLVVANPATFVGIGNFSDPEVQAACLGLVFTLVLVIRKVNGAILLGILGTTPLRNFFAGSAHWPASLVAMPHPSGTLLQLDLRGAAHLGLMEITFAFLFVDLFDNVGTLVGVSEQAGFVKNGKIPGSAGPCSPMPSEQSSLVDGNFYRNKLYRKRRGGLPLARARDLAT